MGEWAGGEDSSLVASSLPRDQFRLLTGPGRGRGWVYDARQQSRRDVPIRPPPGWHLAQTNEFLSLFHLVS